MREKKKKVGSIVKGSRKIHIRGDLWHWKYTWSGIIIQSPELKKSFVEHEDLLPDWDNSSIERARDKRYFHIEPHNVKDYIEKNFYAQVAQRQRR